MVLETLPCRRTQSECNACLGKCCVAALFPLHTFDSTPLDRGSYDKFVQPGFTALFAATMGLTMYSIMNDMRLGRNKSE